MNTEVSTLQASRGFSPIRIGVLWKNSRAFIAGSTGAADHRNAVKTIRSQDDPRIFHAPAPFSFHNSPLRRA